MVREGMIALDPVPQFPLGAPGFPLGQVVVTTCAACKLNPVDVKAAIGRHARGDWGDLEPADWQVNDQRVVSGGPLASIYKDAKGKRFYVLTESDRSVTTVLLPEEY